MSATAPLIAVTGGTGFVGGHVMPAAIAAGYRMRVMARTPSKLNIPSHSNLEVFRGALGTDDAAFVDGADIVLHMAGLIKARNRGAFDAVNVDATTNLARAAQAAGVSRFVLLSSMAARVPRLSDYAASKNLGEAAAREHFTGPLSIIRAPAVFGPGDKATEPFIALIDKGILPVPGGRHWRVRKLSLVAVEDLAQDIIHRACGGAYDGQTVEPASIPSLSWAEFAALAAAARGRPVRAVPMPLSLLYPVAAVTSLLSYTVGVGHLTLGKLREFLYEDWSADTLIQDAAPMKTRLADTLAAFRAAQKSN